MLDRYQGMLYQWYDTTNGHRIRNPGDIDCEFDQPPLRTSHGADSFASNCSSDTTYYSLSRVIIAARNVTSTQRASL